MKRSNLMIVAIAAASLAGCELTDENTVSIPDLSATLANQTGQDGRACVDKGDIRGFGALNDRALFVDTMGDGYFVMTTLWSCYSLDTAFQVGFDSRSYQICGGRSDKILTSDEKCLVKQVFKFDDRKAAHQAVDKAELEREQLKKAAEQKQTNKPEHTNQSA
ncbi:hypothetical protein C2869_17390 [Saccharobesus litoralis]|uniref:Lipoprotein n=1 Tax=Saccharobesus litoralis TaxID=2172099 RepID=A0A2S0VV39_9ALTE|nr:DUF6491 family protein [Saccharobesus litoralis]AWB68086.1 hypothetical protein C2869_17390 [Saccharobesus litoralis]